MRAVGAAALTFSSPPELLCVSQRSNLLGVVRLWLWKGGGHLQWQAVGQFAVTMRGGQHFEGQLQTCGAHVWAVACSVCSVVSMCSWRTHAFEWKGSLAPTGACLAPMWLGARPENSVFVEDRTCKTPHCVNSSTVSCPHFTFHSTSKPIIHFTIIHNHTNQPTSSTQLHHPLHFLKRLSTNNLTIKL